MSTTPAPGALPPLPTFLIIGAQKSATRWLRHNLGEHPDVFTLDYEAMFFSNRRRFRQRGPDWYRGLFEGWDGEAAIGEATPSYMMWRHDPLKVARRIDQTLPDVRLIAVLRNPVDRARSAMLHHIKRERIPRSADLLDLARHSVENDNLGIVPGGWYARSLEPYQQLFGDRLLVVLHDDVADDPRGVYLRSLGHIGVSDDFVPDGLDEVIYSNRGTRDDGLTLDERRELFAYFREDVERLQEMLGRDLSMWDPDHADHDPAGAVRSA